jgi:dipeptidyl aminopeptidase/acylaminoacyl peptidase
MKLWIIGILIILGGFYYWKGEDLVRQENKEEIKLIPRHVLFGNPDRVNVRLSPDGKYLAYRAPHEGVMNVWVQDLEKGTPAEPYTFDKGRGIQGFSWTFEKGVLLYVQDEKGDENWRIYKLDVNTKKTALMTPGEKVQAQILHMHESKPDQVLIALNTRNPIYHDLYRLDLKTEKATLVYENNEFLGLIIDDAFNLRFAFKQTEGGGTAYYKRQGDQWVDYRTLKPEDLVTTSIVGFDKSGDFLYWIDSTEDDKAALIRMNVETQAVEKIFVPRKGDLSSAFTHPREKSILAVIENYLKPELTVLDESIRQDVDYLKTLESGVFDIISTSLDFNHWIVAYASDRSLHHYYNYDRSSKKATYLFSMKEGLDAYAFQPMHPVEIKARDGFILPSYLTLPASHDAKNTGRPNKPVSLALYVHGGPQVRDNWGFDASAQWLANRGYAVLQVNYRGSGGFGKSFLNAGNGEWAKKMHDDLIDAVNWAIAEKIADPEKIAIMGGSYGGYATLVGLTFTPDVFACGVDIVGPSNLETLLESIPEYWKPAMEELKLRIGAGIETPEGRAFLKSRSPISFVDRIQKPLLIAQGANDPRVKKAESDQIVAAMKEKGIPVTYVLYPDEGHGFARPQNRLSFYGITEHFLSQHLGGRFEPLGEDLKKSSAEIVEGSWAE